MSITAETIAAMITKGMTIIMNQILTVAAAWAPSWSFSSGFWNSLTALQIAAVVSAFILTVGAVIEYWYKLKMLAVLTIKLVVGRSTSFERCTLKRVVSHSLGPILVVLGIAGEVVFEGRAFILEDRQEEVARGIVGSLKQEAEEADKKAKTAIADSSTALFQAKDALTKAGTAEVESDKANTAASNALTLAAEATATLPDRKLTDDQVGQIGDKLRPFAGQEYSVIGYLDNPECSAIANRIHKALQSAHWKYIPPKEATWLMAGIVGVLVDSHPEADKPTKDAAKLLAEALTDNGIQAKEDKENPINNPKHNRISLEIGTKR